jgi:esterase/lipase
MRKYVEHLVKIGKLQKHRYQKLEVKGLMLGGLLRSILQHTMHCKLLHMFLVFPV